MTTPTIFLTTLADLPALQTWLGGRKGRLALATLKSGDNVFAAGFKLGTIAIAHHDGTAVAFDGGDRELARAVLQAIFSTGRKVWAYDGQAEAWAIRKGLDVKLNVLRCALVAARTVYPGADTHTLEGMRPAVSVAQRKLRTEVSRVHRGPLGSGPAVNWMDAVLADLPANDQVAVEYVALAAVETALMVGELAADHELRPFIEVELAADVLWRWTGYEGILVDAPTIEMSLNLSRSDRAKARALFGFEPWAGGEELQRWITRHGIALPRTANGSWGMSKDARAEAVVPPQHAEVWAKMCKAMPLGFAFDKLTELQNAKDSKHMVHPEIKVDAAKTGRMSIANPGLQNLPGTMRPVLKARPGYVLVSADLSHVEPSIMAAASGDALLALHCDADHDVYVETAAVVWGEAARERDGAGALTTTAASLRKKAKVVFLALGYGMGDNAFSTMLGTSKADAALVRKKVLGVYKGLGRWIQATRDAAELGETPRTVGGRPLPGCADNAYKADHYIIQGTAKDVFAAMVAEVVAALPAGARPWLPVHDELVIECLKTDAETVGEVLREHMQTTVAGVHIYGEPQYMGVRWAKEGRPMHQSVETN